MSLKQIEIRNLTKKYGKKKVLSNLNLILDNTIFNLLIGPNGCGKTTLIKCLLSLINFDGSIEMNNLSISYAPDKVSLPPFISVYNFLLLLNKTKKMNYSILNQKINYYIKQFNISHYLKKAINSLSMGTKQKIVIIQALINDTDIYIFDEPLNGLDKDSQTIFIQELYKLRNLGKLVIMVSHQKPNISENDCRIISLEDGLIK